LSEGGLFVRTSTPLERGAQALLRFGDQNVEAHARVVWARVEGHGGPAGMGLKFEVVDEGARDAIRRLIETEQGAQDTRSPSN
jgi:Tfp pilus assembly protein PilZ